MPISLNFSSISRTTNIGKLLRLPLSWIPHGTVVPILQGPLQGKRWVMGASTHGCWLGSYELEKQAQVATFITQGSVVYDLGANVGFYTLLFSALVGQQGRVVAFEPAPRNLNYLRRHLHLNRISNVMVVEGAVADTTGQATFSSGEDPSMGHLAHDGGIEVQQFCLDELVERHSIPPPAFIKVDIEGGEHSALLGSINILQTYRPIIALATHGEQVQEECFRLLHKYAYSIQPIGSSGDEFLAFPLE